MKKRVLLITAIGAMASLALSSYDNGAALHSYNRSGAKGSSTTCGGSGCHGTGTTTTAAIRVDSVGGAQVTHYVPGMTYTVTVSGTNSSALPQYGFQYAVVSGTGTAQVQAGSCTGLASGVATHTYSSINFVEHSSPITATTAGTYSTSFQWTAPTASVGPVTMYLTLNAVDGNGNANSADISGNTSISLARISTSAVGTITSDMDINVFPNPVAGNMNVALDNANGSYNVSVYNVLGQLVAHQSVNANGKATTTLNSSNWATGTYHVIVEKESYRKAIQVVKQ